MRDHSEFTFDSIDQQALLAPLVIADTDGDAAIVQCLEELARSYLGWQRQPPSSRSEVRYSLLVLAEEAGKSTVDAEAARKALAARPDEARSRLWAQLISLGIEPTPANLEQWLFSHDVNWSLVARAAVQAASGLKGGDVPNLDLQHALTALVDLFERVTGVPASMSRAITRPRAADFALAFFKCVDRKLDEKTILNSLEKLLTARRRKRAAGRGS
ncbi:hypothetical protein SCH01S_53_00350 [Sphingomonas changbaiensis NBRC 104936]|uniref:Uncharacterized protein n=1 Tax=Sphingomonas changbaiensis NBRC 104936 TaxID=1219043 RepID=A0A0E9MU14_9SPHN|nr:hypothetical protein [Sphingomonas changbaiensis]GAO40963.1 hypothetical protein SCH01S_53_00350 [Sphingomonas changbaiensis NBRC 104936]